MRTMLNFEIDTEAGNEMIQTGKMEQTLKKLMERLHPEAAYFLPEHGHRGGFMIFDLPDTASIPTVIEPLFEGMQAKIELRPVMNLDDLRSGLAHLAGAA